MRIELTIGTGFDKSSNPLPIERVALATRHVVTQAAGLFGGVTVTNGKGAWLDEDKRLVTEPTVTLTVFTSDTDDNRDSAEQLAEIAREAFDQTSVILVVSESGAPLFITQREAIPVG